MFNTGLETNTRGTIMVMVVLRLTADAVVRVLCLFKRTLRLQTVVLRHQFNLGTRVDEVYHPPFHIWDRKLTGSISSIVRPCRRISYQPIGIPTQLVVITIVKTMMVVTQGSHSIQFKRADGGTSNVWYQTSYDYIAEYGNKMAQSADAVFMPVEQQSYDVLLSIGSNGDNDISFRNEC
jgi:hypothetical protein